jgi:hypothetical protein
MTKRCGVSTGIGRRTFNTIGNQQSRPDAALVEKFVNCVDARPMGEYLARRLDPEDPVAPLSLREAVALFFEDNPKSQGYDRWSGR